MGRAWYTAIALCQHEKGNGQWAMALGMRGGRAHLAHSSHPKLRPSPQQVSHVVPFGLGTCLSPCSSRGHRILSLLSITTPVCWAPRGRALLRPKRVEEFQFQASCPLRQGGCGRGGNSHQKSGARGKQGCQEVNRTWGPSSRPALCPWPPATSHSQHLLQENTEGWVPGRR